MVAKMDWIHLVAPRRSERSDLLIVHRRHDSSIADAVGPFVEQNVAGWTKTQNVLRHVLAIVRSTQRANVGPLGVGAQRRQKAELADLAGVIVRLFDVLDDV